MRGMIPPTLPFKIDPAGKDYVTQIVEGVKQAVDDGTLTKGSPLPCRSDFARILGVGEGTVKAAMAALRRDGVIAVRRRIGCTVLDGRRLRCLGDVLFVTTHLPGAYATSVTATMLFRELFKAGYRVTPLFIDIDAPRAESKRLLECALASNPCLVVIWSTPPNLDYVKRIVRAAGKPVITTLAGRLSTSRRNHAIDDLVAACRAARVLSVCQMRLGGVLTPNDAKPALEAAGINVEEITACKTREERHDLYAVQRAAWRCMSRRIESAPLPDAFYITDDYVAAGAIGALAEHGVSIPKDVRLATFSNLGFGPVYSRPLTRIEYDPVLRGKSLGEAIVRFLRTGELNMRQPCSKFIRGESL